MSDFIIFMAPAFVMCLILVGICGYVGIHVIMREVIFIDISLAQLAALGASMGLFLKLEPNSLWSYLISLGFTFAGALLFAGARRLEARVPQEAFIGIVYAVGAAAVLIAGDRLAHGAEHVHDLMCGHLLWVNWKEIGLYSLIFGALGAAYLFCHPRFLEISQMAGKSGTKAAHLMRWDFIFYSLLGILVTFAVRVAGVMVVFGLLIVPAVIGALLGDSFGKRLMLGWGAGVIVTMIGCGMSYYIDLPTGATVVVALGAAVFVIALILILQSILGKTKTLKPGGEGLGSD